MEQLSLAKARKIAGQDRFDMLRLTSHEISQTTGKVRLHTIGAGNGCVLEYIIIEVEQSVLSLRLGGVGEKAHRFKGNSASCINSRL